LITLDTTRVDHLSCYGYERETTPNLDAFAARAVRFDRAWSTSSWTLPAHASLFTGKYPSRHGADYDPRGSAVLGDVIGLPVARHVRAGKLADDNTTLAELMSERGYLTGAFVAGPWLHRSFGLLQGFAHKDDAVSTFGGRPAAEITTAALGWLEGIEPEQPYFLFANYFDPHAPYEPVGRYPEFPRATEPLDYDYTALMRGTAELGEDARAVLRDRYDAEIRDMDHQLGVLLDAVRARPGGDRALVIITADHGEALGEEGRLGHGFWLNEELTRIPLLVRYPGDRDGGSRSEEPMQLTDVLPLLARELDLVVPAQVEGVEQGKRETAFLELRREATTALRFGAAYDRDLQSVIRWPHKLTRSDVGAETLRRLSPESLVEQTDAETGAAAELRRLLDAHAASGPTAPTVAPHADPETVEALRALGYIE
jgi:arylsulfatase